MSKTQAECDGPCPMDEIWPGYYRCKKCGYVKRYKLTWGLIVAWWDRR